MYSIKVNQITEKKINKIVSVELWISKVKKLKNLYFLIGYDNSFKSLQIVVKKEILLEKVKQITVNSYIKVIGLLRYKKPIEEKKFELFANSIIIENISKPVPLLFEQDSKVNEKSDLSYRYLTLRSKKYHDILSYRSKISLFIRQFLTKKNFIEVETPILGPSAYEGATEFKTKVNETKDKYFFLSQSPQLFKQLLMVAGVEKYFQFAKCFRNEKGRNNRQIEFTQLDIEVKNLTEKKLFTLVERLIKKLFKKFFNITLTNNFKKLSFQKAIDNYGLDCPDTRFENLLLDVKELFIEKNCDNEYKKAIFFKSTLDKKFINFLYSNTKKQFNIEKFFVLTKIEQIIKNFPKSFKNIINKFQLLKEKNFTLVIAFSNQFLRLSNFLGTVRVQIAKELKLFSKKNFCFNWIVDWPAFYKDPKTKKIYSFHHPFTKVKFKNKTFKKWDKLFSFAYDLVLNGVEIGGGSIRNHESKKQIEIFKFLNFKQEIIEKEFSWFLDALDQGAPRHGGFALGFDRFLQLILNLDSIKDVIAFPKTNNGQCLLTKHAK